MFRPMSRALKDDPIRRLIRQRIEHKGLSLKKVSEDLGKNHAYIQQFLDRGVPDKLPESVRVNLARLLGVDETSLGGPLRQRDNGAASTPSERSLVYINEHDVRASAGHGKLIDQETIVGKWPFPRDYVRQSLSIRSGNLALIEVEGDSMMPTLHTGDKILVDLDDKNVANPGVFALYDGDATVVKRVEKIPFSEPPLLKLISDNSLHGRYDVLADLVHIAGRVVWFGRRL